jgi:hypothetical protein
MTADAFAISNNGNLVLYLDEYIVEKSKSLGLNLSKTFENHLKQLITQLPTFNPANNFDSTMEKSKWWAESDLNQSLLTIIAFLSLVPKLLNVKKRIHFIEKRDGNDGNAKRLCFV